jgi:hypothetical protein
MTPALLAVAWLSLSACPARAQTGQQIDPMTITRAQGFLSPAKRGQDILSYVHFGSKYNGHQYRETRLVQNGGVIVPGHAAVVYRFQWEGDGLTDVVFLCDANGSVYEVQVLGTNAVLNQPFLTANATIQVLGNLLLAAFQDNLTEAQRRDIQRFIDNADAKGMLEWSLRFQQALGR